MSRFAPATVAVGVGVGGSKRATGMVLLPTTRPIDPERDRHPSHRDLPPRREQKFDLLPQRRPAELTEAVCPATIIGAAA